MSYTYTQYEAALAGLLVWTDYATDPNWTIFLPRCIEYAENRLYRDLDVLASYSVGEVALVAGTRTATVPGTINVVESVNVITPAATAANAGTRAPLQRASQDFLYYVAPTASVRGVPLYYTMFDATTILVVPTPDAAYRLEVTGQLTLAPLASGNTTTYLTTTYPDLFLAASMVFGLGYQRDFGAQSDDPQAAQSWESQYSTLLEPAQILEARRHSEGPGWKPQAPTPIAEPSRT